MRILITVLAAAGLFVLAARAWGGQDATVAAAPAAKVLAWGELAPTIAGPRTAAASAPVPTGTAAPFPDLDVVDAHWMALTMWGEARGEGVEAMRAVGHVIDNRRRASRSDPGFVTDTVGEAFQFSCWNPGDPNREAMMNVDALPAGSHEQRMWMAARALADEILSGRSVDPTDGAHFYHADSVSPAWSRGVEPVRRLGSHLFYRAARRA